MCKDLLISYLNATDRYSHQVFEGLKDQAGVIDNPFSKIPKLKSQPQTREAFTRNELMKIGEHADEFLRPLFALGLYTGLREGDVCTLLWKEVDLANGWITREMMKTGKVVRIPILPAIRGELNKLDRSSKFALPEHAEMYLNNPSGITYRIKKFLESKPMNLTTTRKIKGRSREISVKDFHSLRHTFVWLAAQHGVPLPIVQSVVGHVTPKMTMLYADHATDEAKQATLNGIPNYLNLEISEEETSGIKAFSDKELIAECEQRGLTIKS